jgi:hypothetical protein
MVQDGVRMILCDTPADNYTARAFFEKLGFGDPINHVYMSRNLTVAEPLVRLWAGQGVLWQLTHEHAIRKHRRPCLALLGPPETPR